MADNVIQLRKTIDKFQADFEKAGRHGAAAHAKFPREKSRPHTSWGHNVEKEQSWLRAIKERDEKLRIAFEENWLSEPKKPFGREVEQKRSWLQSNECKLLVGLLCFVLALVVAYQVQGMWLESGVTYN